MPCCKRSSDIPELGVLAQGQIASELVVFITQEDIAEAKEEKNRDKNSQSKGDSTCIKVYK